MGIFTSMNRQWVSMADFKPFTDVVFTIANHQCILKVNFMVGSGHVVAKHMTNMRGEIGLP